jgi:hypothetical protein
MKNIILQFLLQFPLVVILCYGIQDILGRDEWWITLPILIVVNSLYDLGEFIKNNKTDENDL